MTPACLARLNATIAEALPLAQAAGIRLQVNTDDTLSAQAPFVANSNPHATVFGGSLYVAALVAGYAQTVCLVEQAGLKAAVVVRHAEADYRRPLADDFSARVEPIDAQTRTRFLHGIRQHGRGRIDLTITVSSATLSAFTLYARFAAIASGDAAAAAQPA